MKFAFAVIFVIWLPLHEARRYKILTEAEVNHENILSFSREMSAMVSKAASEVRPRCKRKNLFEVPIIEVKVDDVESYLSEAMEKLYIPGGFKYR